MSPAPWNFVAAVPVWWSGIDEDSRLLVRGVSCAAVVVAFDGDDEGGEVAVADDLPKLLLGFEHAGGCPAQRHLAGGPALYVPLGAADDLDHRLPRVGAVERAPPV